MNSSGNGVVHDGVVPPRGQCGRRVDKIAGTRGKKETHVMAMTKTYYLRSSTGLDRTVLFAEQ